MQGVGYRWWAERTAKASNLSGTVRNRLDGTVELIVSGSEAQVTAMIEQCWKGPRGAAVTEIDVVDCEWSGTGFSLLPTA